jgi:hypothetical protein
MKIMLSIFFIKKYDCEIAQDSTTVGAKTKESTRNTEENWREGIQKAMNERNLKEGQWEDRQQWSPGVGQRKKFMKSIYIYIYNCDIYLY